MKKKPCTFWIGTVDYAGYLLRVVSRTKKGAQTALFQEYCKQKNVEFKTWVEFDDYFGPWVQEAKLNEVIWP